jgi:hypothetical protein
MCWLAIAIVLLAPACDQVFSLDRPPEPGTAGDVVVRYTLSSVDNDDQGAPVVHADRQIQRALRPNPPTVRFDGGTMPSLTLLADGGYAFPRDAVDQRYRIDFLTVDGTPIEYQFTTHELSISERVIGRYPLTQPAFATSLIQSHSAEPAGPDGRSVFVSTGIWMQIVSPSNDLAYSIDWTNAKSLSGPIGVLDQPTDRTYGVYHRPSTSTAGPYTELTHSCESSAGPMVNGGANARSCGFVALPRDLCSTVSVARRAESDRLLPTLGTNEPPTQTAFAWALQAVPAPSLGPEPGLALAYESGRAAPDAVRDWTADVTYSNPFPGHEAMLQMTVTLERTITGIGAAVPMTVGASTSHWTPADASCGVDATLAGSIGVPGDAVLHGTFVQNNSAISFDLQAETVLTWGLPVDGPVDYYIVYAQALGNFAGFTYLEKEKERYVTTTREATLSTAQFELGREYVITMEAHLGYPNAATGDLSTVVDRAGTYATSVNYSGVFMVVE